MTVDTENCSLAFTCEYKPVSWIFPAPFTFPHSWEDGVLLMVRFCCKGSIALAFYGYRLSWSMHSPGLSILSPWAGLLLAVAIVLP